MKEEVRKEKALLSIQADEDCFPPGRTWARLAMGQPQGSERLCPFLPTQIQRSRLRVSFHSGWPDPCPRFSLIFNPNHADTRVDLFIHKSCRINV